MLTIKTKFGDLKIREADRNGEYELLDSDDKIMFFACDFSFIYDQVERLNQVEHVSDWLKEFEGVCWGSKQNCLDFARDYAESNDRKFDKNWALDNINRIGDTYFLFDYGDAYLDD